MLALRKEMSSIVRVRLLKPGYIVHATTYENNSGRAARYGFQSTAPKHQMKRREYQYKPEIFRERQDNPPLPFSPKKSKLHK
jgi:hypothetical protein